jgi:hypothetical protein
VILKAKARWFIGFFLDESKSIYKVMTVAAMAGAAIGVGLVGTAMYTLSHSDMNQSINQKTRQIETIQKTLVKLKAEAGSQKIDLAKIEAAKANPTKVFLSIGGHTEEDVEYWRKQMNAFSLMTGVTLSIVGRGASKYIDATALTVNVSIDKTQGYSNRKIATALDFLQLYGYVESFNGNDAIVHLMNKKEG